MDVEIISASKEVSPIFYLVLFAAVAIIASIIILFRSLRYDFKQISKSIVISLLITVGIEIVLLIASFFEPQPMCKTGLVGANCPTNAELLLQSSSYRLPAIFLIVLLIYLIARAVRKR